MREIKFRAWDKVNGRMAYSGYFMDVSQTQLEKWVFVMEVFNNPDNIELMQYTGLKDKNGKEIYEGDIVKNNRHGFISGIEYYGGAFRCKSQGMPLSLYIDDLYVGEDKNQLEVIGNIFENPNYLDQTL